MAEVHWDYTERAKFYDKRADYSYEAVRALLAATGVSAERPVADVGAGTGKLTKLLISAGLKVFAVEPNDAMRSIGISNTQGSSVQWSKGLGEQTGLPDKSVSAVFFGSSFNVLDQAATLKETERILIPGGYFACMWNHRDLDDPQQSAIEQMIQKLVPNYQYGKRREDPSQVINESNLFGNVQFLEGKFNVTMTNEEFVEGWKSHATLERQAGAQFGPVIEKIKNLLSGVQTIDVPYTTRIWFARLNSHN